MMWRLALLFASLSVAASAQLQLFVYDGTSETAAAAITDFGKCAVGDTCTVRFHARNGGTTAVALQTLAVSGQGFTISSQPSLPFTIAPTNFTEFRVQFSATTVASYSATLTANTIQTLLRATVTAAATISPQGGSPLTAGSTIDFGSVQTGQSTTRNLQIANSTSSTLTIPTCAVAGTAFQASALKCPLSLAPGTSTVVAIGFSPTTSGPQLGSLVIDTRTFLLSGTGLSPLLPKPSVTFPAPLTSSSQQQLVIALDSASQTTGTGTVTLSFQPASTGMNDDPAIVFTSNGSRSLSFQVKVGDQTATFPAGVSTTFQTGTTAGTITFHVVMGTYDQQFQFTIAPALMKVEQATAVRRTGDIDVSVTAFDNTGTAGAFSFTFYNTSGGIVQPGAIGADWSTTFANYFKLSKVGGGFTMRATFPVIGDATGIAAVLVQMTNSVGTTQTARISF